MPGPAELLDINVWLALCIEDHPHHARAQHFWSAEAGEQQVFCRVTALGFLRLCTNATVMAGQPLSIIEAWRLYQSLRRLPEIGFAAEPEQCETLLDTWVTTSVFPARLWTDAYLAAFAYTGKLRLVSFDGDYRRFPALDFHHLAV